MKKIRLIYKELTGLFICSLIIFFEFHGFNGVTIGKIFENNFYCGEPTPFQNWPCWAIVDIIFREIVCPILLVLGLIFIFKIFVKIFKK